MLAIFAADLWVTRAIVVRRTGKVRFGHAVATFALLWVYPVGVWFVHPWARKAAGETAGGVAVSPDGNAGPSISSE
jgi:hypothetical protein